MADIPDINKVIAAGRELLRKAKEEVIIESKNNMPKTPKPPQATRGRTSLGLDRRIR